MKSGVGTTTQILAPKQPHELDIENILTKHGGEFMFDFGIPASNIQYVEEAPRPSNLWDTLMKNITGKTFNPRVENTIKQINENKAIKHATRNDANGENFIRNYLVQNESSKHKAYFENMYDRYLNKARNDMSSNHGKFIDESYSIIA